jgi:hypothetical protein
MQTPTRHEAAPSSLRRSERLLRRSKPIQGISTYVSEFEQAATSLENRYDAWTLARHQLRVAIGVQHEAEEGLDEELRATGMAILASDRGRRSSENYRRYFPEGYGSSLSLSAEESLPIAAGVLAAMGNETNADILARRDRLTAACAQLENATAARKASVAALSQAKAILEEEKLNWRKAHETFYCAVRLHFSGRRGYVESLFRVNGRSQPVEDTPPAEAEPADGAEPIPVQPIPVAPVTLVPPPAAPAATIALVTTPAAITAAHDPPPAAQAAVGIAS